MKNSRKILQIERQGIDKTHKLDLIAITVFKIS